MRVDESAIFPIVFVAALANGFLPTSVGQCRWVFTTTGAIVLVRNYPFCVRQARVGTVGYIGAIKILLLLECLCEGRGHVGLLTLLLALSFICALDLSLTKFN